VRIIPNYIQDDLILFKDVISDDPNYENDDSVIAKYQRDPLKYIISDDPIKIKSILAGKLTITPKLRNQSIDKNHAFENHFSSIL